MFGFVSEKRFNELESKFEDIKNSLIMNDPDSNQDSFTILSGCGETKTVRAVVKQLHSDLKDIKKPVADSIKINEKCIGILYGGEPHYVNDGEVSLKQAILAIAAHLGIKFEVEPAKGEQVKLVKVKK